jgi:hypothetical protein
MHEIQFQLRPHSKKEAAAPGTERGKLPRVAEVLALAIGLDDMIRRGLAKDTRTWPDWAASARNWSARLCDWSGWRLTSSRRS